MEGALKAGFWGFVGGVSLLIGAMIGLFISQPLINIERGTFLVDHYKMKSENFY